MNPKQNALIAAYRECGNVTLAARAAKVGRRTHYDWMQQDEAYALKFAEAEEEATELLEAEARRRATEGVHEPVIYQGEMCFAPAIDAQTGEVIRDPETGKVMYSDTPLYLRKPSDNLLMFLLKSKRPEKYRDNAKVEHTGPGGGPLTVTVEFVQPKAA